MHKSETDGRGDPEKKMRMAWPYPKEIPISSITRQALTWNPQGKRRQGRPRNTWRRELHANIKELGMGWPTIVKEAQDRRRWRAVVNGLCSRRSEGP